jgi:hypothetical protein
MDPNALVEDDEGTVVQTKFDFFKKMFKNYVYQYHTFSWFSRTGR